MRRFSSFTATVCLSLPIMTHFVSNTQDDWNDWNSLIWDCSDVHIITSPHRTCFVLWKKIRRWEGQGSPFKCTIPRDNLWLASFQKTTDRDSGNSWGKDTCPHKPLILYKAHVARGGKWSNIHSLLFGILCILMHRRDWDLYGSGQVEQYDFTLREVSVLVNRSKHYFNASNEMKQSSSISIVCSAVLKTRFFQFIFINLSKLTNVRLHLKINNDFSVRHLNRLITL